MFSNLNNQTLILVIALTAIPFLLGALGLILGNKFPVFRGRWSGITLIISSFFAGYLMLSLWNSPSQSISISWLELKNTSIDFGFYLDNISILLFFLVLLTSGLVHLYSKAYMGHSQEKNDYWWKLSFFTFSMLGLILMNNLLWLFVFWELVGFTSYLLIGFYVKKKGVGKSALYAFLVNRVGDILFLIGILILFVHFKTLDIIELIGSTDKPGLWSLAQQKNGYWISQSSRGEVISSLPYFWKSVCQLCLIGGALSKSAQFPFHIWLPKAMVGPTPVSSLIHAATMVAAGVYLISRLFPIFDVDNLLILSYLAIFTSLIAGVFALAAKDLKQVLAWSTVSQLGFMMLALGVGSVSSAIFHLTTHAFFKCLLFLSAGTIITFNKNMQGEKVDSQNLHIMGGFKKYIPKVFYLYLIGAAALIGLPLFSGFLSKDAVILAIGSANLPLGTVHFLSGLSVLATLLTGAYVARMTYLIFFGEFRGQQKSEPQDCIPNNNNFLLPPAILAILSVGFWFSINPFNPAGSWIVKGIGSLPTEGIGFYPYLALLFAMLGVLGVWFYFKRTEPSAKAEQEPELFILLLNKQLGYPALINFIFIKPVLFISVFLKSVDVKIIDGAINGLARLILNIAKGSEKVDKHAIDGAVNAVPSGFNKLSKQIKKFQGGNVQKYMQGALWIIIIVVLTLIIKSILP